MAFDREDYLDLRKRKNGKDRNYGLEYLVQAQVVMENLTGDQYWDRFLSYIQGTLDRMRDEKTALERALCDSALIDQNEIMATKTALARASTAVEVLEAVIALPNDIRETGKRAKKRLEELEQGISGGD